MFDYYEHVNSLSEDKLSDEIQKVLKRINKASPGSPMYNQLISMLNTAQMAYSDLMSTKRVKNKDDEVLEIGEMESTVTTPDYSDDQVLDILVHGYLKDPKNE